MSAVVRQRRDSAINKSGSFATYHHISDKWQTDIQCKQMDWILDGISAMSKLVDMRQLAIVSLHTISSAGTHDSYMGFIRSGKKIGQHTP